METGEEEEFVEKETVAEEEVDLVLSVQVEVGVALSNDTLPMFAMDLVDFVVKLH